MEISIASNNDVEEILALQKLAYLSEAELYGDFTIEPLTQTIDEARADCSACIVLKAVVDGKIVGSVRGAVRDGTCFIGKLIVHPDFQNRGIASRLMLEIETAHPKAGRFELFTGWKSAKNLHLYEKLGYKTYEIRDVSDKLKLACLEKTVIQ
jgi:ribosomal protein S18 acetylase RimI-like enzyme